MPGKVTVMFPKAYKYLRQDIDRIDLALGPLTCNQPELGAVFGELGPPVLARMRVGHIQVVKGAK